MARSSELLKNFGKTFEVVKTLINAVLDLGGNDEDFLRILKDKGLAVEIAKLILAGKATGSPDGLEPLNIDYEKPLPDAIKEGAFDWKNDDITSKNFPNGNHEKGEATIKVKLYHFGRDMSSEGVVSAMGKDGFRPAMLRELLAFAAKNPDEQRKYPIVGLGSVLRRDVDRDVPYLRRLGDERDLDLSWWGDDWLGDYRFLAVSKS